MNKNYSRRKFVGISGVIGLSTIISSSASIVPSQSNNMSILPSPDLNRIKMLLEQNDPVTWLFTGDSITQGAKHTNGYRCYPEIFSERIRWEMKRKRDVIINTAISGDTTDNIIKDFEWRVQQFNPDVASLMIGTNDCAYPSITSKNFEESLFRLVDKIKASGCIPLLHTPNAIIQKDDPVRSRLPEFVSVIKQVAKTRELILIDHWDLWSKENKAMTEWLDDAIHPNFKGHAEMAKLLFKTLNIFENNAFTCK